MCVKDVDSSRLLKGPLVVKKAPGKITVQKFCGQRRVSTCASTAIKTNKTGQNKSATDPVKQLKVSFPEPRVPRSV